MKKIWHHYLDWEEYHAGMWRHTSGEERQKFLDIAIKFTGDVELYGHWMLEVVKHWHISCEQHLSDVHMNRQAWIGHAACCMATGCPEDVTRSAWSQLSVETQDLANAKAQTAIELWEQHHAIKNSELHKQVGKTRVS